MRAINLCIAASVLLCLVASPAAARQLRQEPNVAVVDNTTAASPPAATAVEPSPTAVATSPEPTPSPSPMDTTAAATPPADTTTSPPVSPEPSPSPDTVVVVDNTTAASPPAAETTASPPAATETTAAPAAAINYTAAYPSFMDAVTAANTTAAGNLSILMSALEAANISNAITNETAWTILAPNNAAFEKALAALNITAQELLANKTTLTTILAYHVIPSGAINSSMLTTGASVPTALAGFNLTVDITNATGTPNVTFIGASNNASVVAPDIIAGNSTIHVIDSVLLPPANATLMPASNATTTGANATSTSPNVTVIVLNGTDNATASPPPAESPVASPPADTTTVAASPPVDNTTATTPPADTTAPTGNAATDATGANAAGTNTPAANTGASTTGAAVVPDTTAAPAADNTTAAATNTPAAGTP